MIRRIALAGNPNSGKTTLFNQLTGTRQTTGNWPGVTVEKKEGVVRHSHGRLYIVDLPGIYSLSPYSMEEVISRNFIQDEKPDIVVNIVDATHLERNLYLTLQLKKLGRPMVLALNMMDEVVGMGDRIDIRALSERLGIPVVPVSAKHGSGLDDLVGVVWEMAFRDDPEVYPLLRQRHGAHGAHGPYGGRRHRGRRGHPHDRPGFLGHLHHHIDHRGDPGATAGRAEDHEFHDYHAYFDHLRHVDHSEIMQADFRPETEEETAQMYQQAVAIHDAVYRRADGKDALSFSDKIDRVLTHRILALPIFLLIMFLVFQLSFSPLVGGRLTDALEVLFNHVLGGWVTSLLDAAGAAPWIGSLLVGGVISGVGGVLTFVPQITLLFLSLTILEDSGYMARAAFITDRLFQKLGLTGRSFIPMLLGFGCTVPAVMAARSLGSEKERRLTIMITPFMSCGARMPIYAFFAATFFTKHQGLVSFSMYLIGIAVAILSATLLSRTVFRGADAPFIIELPPYRLPDGRSLFLHIWDRVRDFIVRAGTIIFAMTVVVWFLQSFDFSLRMVADNSESIIAGIGRGLAHLLVPLGFGSWQTAVAILTGLVAKESVVSTLEVLYSGGEFAAAFTPLTAYAFMVFTLLYMPCLAAFGAIRREMGSWRWALATAGYGTGAAYLVSLLVYQAGRLLL
ncbi:MAG: ferrous iron transport protein B [Clostridia bacterium]|nr:ferrous iron transport protein B [Clostridia bacterium]